MVERRSRPWTGRIRGGLAGFVVAALLMPVATGWAGGRGAAKSLPAAATPTVAMSDHGHHVEAAAGVSIGEERAAADRLVRDVTAAADRFADVQAARADGFVQMMPCWFDDIPAAYFLSLAAVTSDRLLDPERPEGLICLRPADGRLVLLGAMFVAPTPEGPRLGGARRLAYSPRAVHRP